MEETTKRYLSKYGGFVKTLVAVVLVAVALAANPATGDSLFPNYGPPLHSASEVGPSCVRSWARALVSLHGIYRPTEAWEEQQLDTMRRLYRQAAPQFARFGMMDKDVFVAHHCQMDLALAREIAADEIARWPTPPPPSAGITGDPCVRRVMRADICVPTSSPAEEREFAHVREIYDTLYTGWRQIDFAAWYCQIDRFIAADIVLDEGARIKRELPPEVFNSTPCPHRAATPQPPDPKITDKHRAHAYQQGLRDRAAWEEWFSSLQGDYKTGAFYWTSQRSLPHPGSCQQMNAEFTAGCTAAKSRLDLSDALRRSQPDYKLGWNAWTPSDRTNPAAAANQNPDSSNAASDDPLALIQQEREQDDLCRGAVSPDDPRVGPACTARQSYAEKLNALGWCYGKQGQLGYEMDWHRCGPDSLRLEQQTVPVSPVHAQSVENPFAYCRAERNTDVIQETPQVILDAIGGDAWWRCKDGEVYGCLTGASGRGCLHWKNLSKEPTQSVTRACARGFVSEADNDTPYEWTCEGGKPVLDISVSMRLDKDGYYVEPWRRISASAAQSPPAPATLPPTAYAPAPESATDRVQRMLAVSPGLLRPEQRDCLVKQTFRGDALAIRSCSIPHDLYGPAVNFLGSLNNRGELIATAFLHQFCEKSMEVGISYTCTHEDVTIAWRPR